MANSKTNHLTIKKARKILGKLAENISDEELKKEIMAAELLKTIYFSSMAGNNKLRPCKNNYGKA